MSWSAALPWAHGLSAADMAALFGHFLLLSLLSIGGAIATAPDMHRFLVQEHRWIGDAQFTSSIALAQAAPGPNLLFVPVLGWNVAGAWGLAAAMVGILLPSSLLTYTAARWGRTRRESLAVRAFTHGMAPLTMGMLLSTGWVLSQPFRHSLGATLLVLATVAVMARTRLNPLWLIGAGAVAGAFGWT